MQISGAIKILFFVITTLDCMEKPYKMEDPLLLKKENKMNQDGAHAFYNQIFEEIPYNIVENMGNRWCNLRSWKDSASAACCLFSPVFCFGIASNIISNECIKKHTTDLCVSGPITYIAASACIVLPLAIVSGAGCYADMRKEKRERLINKLLYEKVD